MTCVGHPDLVETFREPTLDKISLSALYEPGLSEGEKIRNPRVVIDHLLDSGDTVWFPLRGGATMVRGKTRNSSLLIGLMFALTSCKDSEKRLSAAERRQKELEAENTELKLESASRIKALKEARVGDGAVWVIANFNVNYADASAICSKLSYELPTESNLAELEQRDPDSPANTLIQGFKMESTGQLRQIHLRDKTVELAKGVVICRKPNG